MGDVSLESSTNFDNHYYVAGNKGRIQQVVISLLANAKAATLKGSQNRGIHMNIDRDDSSIYLSVQDNGIGIPKANESNIFDSFFTTKPADTGIGLSISESIVAEHDAKLTFEAIENQDHASRRQ